MKLTRVQARPFGGLENFDSGPSPLGALNVVIGPNESGKTTFFHLLHSIIFGLYPASKDQHPYTPWSGLDLDINAELVIDNGEKWAVQRKLAGSPTAILTRDGVVEKIRNETLPCATHVTRDVFHQVFALTLAEIASLESQAWSDLQDRLIGGMGARDLVPARSVAKVLEAEAHRLWRPKRQGTQEVRLLRERIRVAKAARSEALEADRVQRESMRDLERTEADRGAARLEAEKHGLLIERITTLLPIQVRMEQAARLDEEAGPAGALDGLPADPAVERVHLLDEVAALEDRLLETQTLTKKAQEQTRAFSTSHQRNLDARPDIEEIGGALAATEPVSARVSALDQEIRDRERRIASAMNEVFERTLTAQEESTVRGLGMRDLHDRVRDAHAARDRMRDHSMRATLGGTLPEASASTLALGIVAALAAAVLLFWPGATPLVRVLGGATAVGASMLVARWGTLRQAGLRQRAGGRGSASDGDTTPAQEFEETAASLRDFLSGLPVRSDQLTEAGSELVTTLTRLQELWEDLETRTEERNEANEALDETHHRLAELGTRLELEVPQVSAAAIHILRTTLRESEQAEAASKRAGAELDRLTLEESKIKAKLGTRTKSLESLERALRALGGGDLETGTEAAIRMRRAGETAGEIRAHLERTHGSLDDLRARLNQLGDAEDGYAVDGDDALAKARAAEKECLERIKTLDGRIRDLENTCRRAAELPTVDQVDGEIDALGNELLRLER